MLRGATSIRQAASVASLSRNGAASLSTFCPKTFAPLYPHGYEKPKILNSVLDHVGDTPLVRLNRIAETADLKCELLAKCEFFNAGGSVKDRIGKRMVEDAIASGRIKKGDTLIEPTSGNTGIGLALASAIYGFRCIITLPEKMSDEKVNVLKALGAEIIRTPTEAAFDSPESHIGVAARLQKEIPNAHILDQYTNESNPLAHYDGTAEELLEQCDGHIDMVVISAGTGGTLSGIARKLKERIPSIKIVAVDPVGSILAQPEELNTNALESYQVEGIGYDFIPEVLDRNLVDYWIKSKDEESFIMSRRLIKEEGLLCGGSSGSAVASAVKAASILEEGQRCVVILADGTRNYMTKFLADSWMREHEYGDFKDDLTEEAPWASHPVSRLKFTPPVTVTTNVSCKDAVDLLGKHDFDVLPVCDPSGKVLGIVSSGGLSAQLTRNTVSLDDPVENAMYKNFKTISLNDKLSSLGHFFDKDHFALVTTDQMTFDGTETSKQSVVCGVITRIDLLNYIMAQN